MFKEFKTFIMRGNVLDLAIGVIIGGAFGKIVASLVGDILNPIIGLASGKIDFANLFVALNGQTTPPSRTPSNTYWCWLLRQHIALLPSTETCRR